MKVLIEKVRRYEVGATVVRIWTQRRLPTCHEVGGYVLTGAFGRRNRVDTIARDLLQDLKANAVEVTRRGTGVVAYADWP